jgi:hypothetical protein
MSVTIHCPHCGATGNAPDHILGQSVRCSKCKKQFVAGGEEEPEQSEEIPEEEPADNFDDMDDAPPPSRSRGRAPARRTSGGGGGGAFAEFATFRMLVAPRIIVILFWVAVAVFLLFALASIVMAFFVGVVYGLTMLIAVPIGTILQVIVLRIVFEMMMIQFRIYEALKDLKKPE